VLLVVDANVLVGELLRVRGRELFETVVLRLYISEQALDEALHEMSRRAARIVEQGKASKQAVEAAMLDEARGIVERRISQVPSEVYAGFEERAAYRVPRDPDDVPTVALALALEGDEGHCGIWTNDGDFLGCGLPTWTTDTLLAHLRYGERAQR
jgi:predicted nucleic acid-binding protein